MITRIKNFLAPPVFQGDELKTRQASLLNLVLLSLFVLAILMFLGNTLSTEAFTRTRMFGNVFLAACCIGLSAWMRRGNVQAAGILTLVLSFVLLTTSVALRGTIRTQNMALFFLVILIAGILFEARGIIIATLSSSIALAGLIWAENAGLLPPPDYTDRPEEWLVYTALFGLVGSLSLLALGPTRRALERADNEIAERKRIEEQLRASEERFRGSFSEHSAIMLLVDPSSGMILDANRAAAEFYGYALETLRTMHIDNINALPPEQITEMRRRAVFQHQNTFIFPHRRADGEIRTVEVYSSLIPLGSQSVLFSVIHDITERKQAEDALHASEEKYRALFENMQEGFSLNESITDADGHALDFRVLDANAAYEQHTGFKPQDIIGKTILEILPQADPRQIESYGKVAQTGEPLSFEYYSKAFNRHLRVRAFSPRRGQFATLFEDISERKRAEAQVAALTTEMQTILETVSAGICHLKNRQVVWANAAFDELFGYARGTTKGLDTAVFHTDQASYIQIGQSAYPLLAQGDTFTAEQQMRKQDGTLFWCSLTGRAFTPQESAQDSIWMLEDITTRKQSEDALRESEARWQFALEGAGDGVWDWNAQTNRVYFSRQWKAMLGFEPDEVGDSLDEWDKRVHPDDKAATYAALEQHFSGKTPVYVSEHRVQCKDGSYKWILDRGKVIARTSDGKPLRVIGTHTDITARKRAELELRKLSSAVEQSPSIIVITDLQGNIEYVNPRFTQVTGYTAQEAYGQNPRILKSGFTPGAEYKHLWQTIAAGGEWHGEFHNRKKNGELYWETATITPVLDEQGTIINYLAVKEDITARKQMEQQLATANAALVAQVAELSHLQAQLREQSIRDPLTQLYNRRYLNETMPREIARALRMKQMTGVLMLDLDHFKHINDTYGHLAGDECLLQAAQTVQANLRASDIVCRFGGEEMLCLLFDTNVNDTIKRAEQVRAAIETMDIRINGERIPLTTSIGVAVLPPDGSDMDAALRVADDALYRAKQDGRNCVRTAQF